MECIVYCWSKVIKKERPMQCSEWFFLSFSLQVTPLLWCTVTFCSTSLPQSYTSSTLSPDSPWHCSTLVRWKKIRPSKNVMFHFFHFWDVKSQRLIIVFFLACITKHLALKFFLISSTPSINNILFFLLTAKLWPSTYSAPNSALAALFSRLFAPLEWKCQLFSKCFFFSEEPRAFVSICC